FSADPGFYDPNSRRPRFSPWRSVVVVRAAAAGFGIGPRPPQRCLGPPAIRQGGAHAGGSQRTSPCRAHAARIPAGDRLLPPRLLRVSGVVEGGSERGGDRRAYGRDGAAL